MRLIDADELECVSATMPKGASEDYKEGYGDGMNYVLEIVDDLPTIELVKHGKWIKHKDGYYRCSECGSRGSAIKAHYCHHCGADMRGE